MHLGHSHEGSAAVSADARRPDGSRRALRIGLGGPVGSGKTATVAALCRALRDRAVHRRRHQRHLHPRGRRLPAAQRRTAARADPGRRDRGLPAHRDPRRHLRQPRSRRGLGGRRRTARSDPRRVRRRQPHRHLLQGTRRRPDLRHRRGRRRRHPAQGRPGRVHRRPARGQQDRPRAATSAPTSAAMARDAKEQRAELPVVFQSLRSEGGVGQVAGWVREQLAAWTGADARRGQGCAPPPASSPPPKACPYCEGAGPARAAPHPGPGPAPPGHRRRAR